MELLLSVQLSGGPALEAATRWADVIKKGAGEDYLMKTRFNCNRKFDGYAHSLFAQVRVTSIMVGYDLPVVGTPCSSG